MGLKYITKNVDVRRLLVDASYYHSSLHNPTIDCSVLQDVVEHEQFIVSWQEFLLNPTPNGYQTIDQCVYELFLILHQEDIIYIVKIDFIVIFCVNAFDIYFY